MPAVKIDLKKLDDLIARKGVNLLLYRVVACPCRDDNGYVDPTCTACLGTGFAPGQPAGIRALLLAHDASKQPLPAGINESGMRSLTPPRHVRLAEGDWVRMAQYRVRTSEVITPGAAFGSRLDTLFPDEVLGVSRLVDGALTPVPAEAYTDPVTGAQLLPDGALAWQPDALPAGTRVTVEFHYWEAYQVWRGSMAMQRGAEDKRLPDKALVRRITRKVLRQQLAGDGL